MTDDDDTERTEDGEDEVVVQPLPRWLRITAAALLVGTIVVVLGWSLLWWPDGESWGEKQCRVEADRAWPRDHPQHEAIEKRCLAQLP